MKCDWSLLRNCINKLCPLITIQSTGHEIMISIFNGTTSTQRRFSYMFKEQIMIQRITILKLLTEVLFLTSNGKLFHSLIIDGRK